MSPRRFSRQEAAALVRRAAELQGRHAPEAHEHLTLPDLEAIAAETGVEVQYLRQALAEQDAASHIRTEPARGRVTLERTLPVPADQDAFKAVVAELRHRFEHDGPDPTGRSRARVLAAPHSLEWRNTDVAGNELRLLLQADGSRTRVRLSHTVQPGCGALALGCGVPLLFGAIGFAVFDSGAAAVLIGVTALVLAVLASRYDRRRIAQESRSLLEGLAADVEQRLHGPTDR